MKRFKGIVWDTVQQEDITVYGKKGRHVKDSMVIKKCQLGRSNNGSNGNTGLLGVAR